MWKIGDNCLAYVDGEWQRATIKFVSQNGSRYRVVLNRGEGRQVADVLSSLVRKDPGGGNEMTDASRFQIGVHCEAKWQEDGQWYAAVVDNVFPQEKRCQVTFTEYGNSDLVPFHDIKLPAPSTVASNNNINNNTNTKSHRSANNKLNEINWSIGDSCEACWTQDDVWYPAVIRSISADGQRFLVCFIEYGNEEEVTKDRLRKVTIPMDMNIQWNIGDPCQAVWEEDGQWYDAVIEGMEPTGEVFAVYFVEYGNRANIIRHNIRPKHPQQSQKQQQESQPPQPKSHSVLPPSQPQPHQPIIYNTMPHAWKVGDTCEACWTEDNEWYLAVIMGTDGTRFHVSFPEYGNEDVVDSSRIRPATTVAPAPAHLTQPLLTPMAPPVALPMIPVPMHPNIISTPVSCPPPPLSSQPVQGVVNGIQNMNIHENLAYPMHTQSPPRPQQQPSATWKIGDICEACWSEDNVWYPAQIENISLDGTVFTVMFLEYGNLDTVAIDRLRKAPSNDTITTTITTTKNNIPSKWKVGANCEAQWTDDNEWYTAVIQSISTTPSGNIYHVYFTDYGNEDQVSENRLRPIATSTTSTAASTAKQATSLPPTSSSRWKVGDTCEAQWTEDDEWYAAEIQNITSSPNGIVIYHVFFPEYGNDDQLSERRLRPVSSQQLPAAATASTLATLPASRWKKGNKCEAQWTEDSNWYPAVIQNISSGPGGRIYHVLFTEYGNDDQVLESHLRPAMAPSWKIGDTCEAQWTDDDEWYIATIQNVESTPKGNIYHVFFTEYGNDDQVPESRLRPVITSSVSSWKVGDKCEAQWTDDDEWYTAVIQSVSSGPNGKIYHVFFPEYGNDDDVSESRLRPTTSAAATTFWKLGDKCDAQWTEDDEWYAAVIQNISPDGKLFEVHFPEYGNADVVSTDRLRPLGSMSSAVTSKNGFALLSWKVDDVCMAQWTEDNEWYAAVIKEISSDGKMFRVFFPEYGNEDVVPAERLRRDFSQPIIEPSPSSSTLGWNVGDACEAPSPLNPSHWIPARIDFIYFDNNIADVTIASLGEQKRYSLSEIRKPKYSDLDAPSTSQVYEEAGYQVDSRCLARRTEKDPWRPALIKAKKKDESMYKVTFDDNVALEEVKITPNNMRPLSEERGLGDTVSKQLDSFFAHYTGQSFTINKQQVIDYSAPPEDYDPDRINIPKPLERLQKPRKNRVEISSIEALQDDGSSDVDMIADLPITQHREHILRLIEENQVVIVSGSTGCGKTTQVPQYILEEASEKRKNCRVVCTQPRRIAAISVARRVSHERHTDLGYDVGYQVSMDKKVSDKTSLLYCTTGILKERLIYRKSFLPFTHVIIDEVHERDSDTDFVLLMIRELLRVTKSVKVILMSATIDVHLFSAYFGDLSSDRFKNGNVPIAYVEGRMYDVDIHYLDKLDKGKYLYALPPHALPGQLFSLPEIKPEMYDVAAEIIERICNLEFASDDEKIKGHYRAILVFLPGLGEIHNLNDVLIDRLSNTHDMRKFTIITLHSTLSGNEQQQVFKRIARGHRKIILATNIAESSITVPDVRYVIDFCLVKENYCDNTTKYQGLRLTWQSRAAGTQRSGRAGRVQHGHCFRLCPQRFWEEEIDSQVTPEIKRVSLDNLILQTKVLRVGDPRKILDMAMQAPDRSGIDNSLKLLTETGALSKEPTGKVINFVRQEDYDGTGKITKLGEIYARLPVDIRISRLIVFGIAFNLPYEAMIMGACISLTGSGIFTKSLSQDFELYKSKIRWGCGLWSDPISALVIYQAWDFLRANRINVKEWARKENLNLTKLREAQSIVDDLAERITQSGVRLPIRSYDNVERKFKITPNGSELDLQAMFTFSDTDALLLKLILCAAFYPNFLISLPKEKHDMEYAFTNGIRKSVNYNPWRTVILKATSSDFPPNIEQHIQRYFSKCGEISKCFVEGAKCFVEFARGEDDHSEDSIPDIPEAVFLAIRCWQMENRRNRRSTEAPTRRDPKYFIGGYDMEYGFQILYKKLGSHGNVRIQSDSVLAVSLIKDPAITECSVVVTPFVAAAQSGSGLVASQCTYLEGRPLLPALLCMLFTHDEIELFPNAAKTRYGGVRVGELLEIIFDAEFDDNDVRLLNHVRELFQHLVLESIFDPHQLHELSLRMKRKLLELIGKPRKTFKSFNRGFIDTKKRNADWDSIEWQESFTKKEEEPIVLNTKADIKLFPTIQPVRLKKGAAVVEEEVVPQPEYDEPVTTFVDRIAQQKVVSTVAPILICRLCSKPIGTLDKLRYVPNPVNENMKPVFELLDSYGLAFSGMKRDVVCRGGHSVGTVEDDRLTINKASNIRIRMPDGETTNWNPAIWNTILPRY